MEVGKRYGPGETLDISRLRLIAPDASVWLIYAGKRRKFFDVFAATKSVFLDIPGFDASVSTFVSEDEIRRHLAMSDQINRYLRGARETPPSRNPSAYDPNPYESGSSDAKTFSAEVGNIVRLFSNAKVGDLILSPPIGHYAPMLIGEIELPWQKSHDLSVEMLNGEKVPTRKVLWLDAPLARRDFSPRVSKNLQNGLAITKIDPEFYEEIFGAVYPSYIWGNKSKLDIFADKYTSSDPMQPFLAARLIKYVIASAFAFEIGEFAEFQDLTSDVAIDKFYTASLVSAFTQNFNSPGKFSLTALAASIAMLVSAGLLVSIAGDSMTFSAAQQMALDKVKGATVGDGKADLELKLDDYVNSMKAVNWKKVQSELGKPAKESVGLSLDNKVQVAMSKAQLDGQ